MKDILVIANC